LGNWQKPDSANAGATLKIPNLKLVLSEVENFKILQSNNAGETATIPNLKSNHAGETPKIPNLKLVLNDLC